jgi:hypothetical protein
VLLLENGQPMKIGSPGDVIAEYCAGTSTNDQDAVAISAVLRGGRRSTGGTVEVAPGERIIIDAAIDFHVDVDDATVGVVVWDLSRELYVYGASSDRIGMPLVRAAHGETKRFTFCFDANLARGLYALEINVVDHVQHRFLGCARGIRHFQVVEHVTFDGVANLYLSGREVARDASDDPRVEPALASEVF